MSRPDSEHRPINLREKFDRIGEQWSPKVVAELNDYQFKLVKLQGEFVWHSHADTDEAFIVVRGSLLIRFRDGSVTLKAGEMYVVPRGVEHQPVADEECEVMLIEPAGVVNTGDAVGVDAAPNDVWV